jgi:hypothetical protein
MKKMNVAPVNLSGDSFYSHKDNILYYCIPKVASRSILELCFTVFPEGYRIGEKKISKHQFFDSIEKHPFRFAFVRDPIERILSFYFDKCVNYDGSEGKKQMFARYKYLYPTIPLKTFIKWLGSDEASDKNADHHFCSQYLFLYSNQWKRCVDYVGYLQTIEQDIVNIGSHIGREISVLPHLNSNANPKERKIVTLAKDYLDYLDSSNIRLLQKRYEADYDLFNFKSQFNMPFFKINRIFRLMWRYSGFAKIEE